LVQADAALPENDREALAATLKQRARGLVEAQLSKGLKLSAMRKDPSLANQWDKVGFTELLQAIEHGQ
jgi:hypothetical protein